MKIERFAVLALALICLTPLALCQKNSAGVFAVGNFNPSYQIYLTGFPGLPVYGSNKSSLVGGLEYQRQISRYFALSASYTQGPSDGKLIVPKYGLLSIWPTTQYDVLVTGVENFKLAKFTPFVTEGGGAIMTWGPTNSGLSADPTVAIGYGTDYRLSPHLSLRLAAQLLFVRQGCYGDPTCSADLNLVKQLPKVGLFYNW